MKNNVFSSIDESKLFEEFNMEFISFVKELTDIESDEGNNTLIICDDVGPQLRRDAQVEKKLLCHLLSTVAIEGFQL